MNQEKFIGELKEALRAADWHRRYHSEQARRYNRRDYWLRTSLGTLAVFGVLLSSSNKWSALGAILAGSCAIVIANLLPIFKWDTIITELNEAENEWMRIFKGYQEVISFYEISNREEILVQEFQRIKEMQKAAALSNKRLPINKKLLQEKDAETRAYYSEEDSILPLDNPK